MTRVILKYIRDIMMVVMDTTNVKENNLVLG